MIKFLLFMMEMKDAKMGLLDLFAQVESENEKSSFDSMDIRMQ